MQTKARMTLKGPADQARAHSVPVRRRSACSLALAAALLAACAGPDDTGSTAQPAAASSTLAVPAESAARAETPVTVEVCGEPVTYPLRPRRAVTHDVNITEMFLYLGLADTLVGYSGLRDAKRVAPQFRPLLEHLPNLSAQGMNLETIVGAEADFVFGGWSYGFRQGQVTPQALAELGIASYVLTESCIRVSRRERVSLEDTFTDMRNIGRIFRIDDAAQALIDAQRAELAQITRALDGVTRKPRVFVYDSGTELPQTSGRFGMPHAMIENAGGSNIFADIESSWPKGNWEDVVARDPEWIIIIDYDPPGPQGKKQFLLDKPELAAVTAIREQNFVVLEYAEATPGPRNVAAVRTLARAFHPERIAP